MAFAREVVPERRTGAVRLWLWGLAALVLAMVVVGGATRLTGSGLSITEWKPVTGAVPPLSDDGWAAEFEKYRGSSQYENLNRGMELDEFKTIYWWEWSHRQLGRFLGVYLLGPLLWFWWRGRIGGRLALALLGIGALGGLQATVGWIMVASGLEPGMTAVAPLKLSLHLTVAAVIVVLIVSVIAGLSPPGAVRGGRGASRAAGALVVLILVQIALGGLVAGSRAGLTYNTWPLMDGRLVPPAEALFVVRPWIENWIDNPALVQLNHRLTAYLVLAACLWHAWSARRSEAAGSRAAAIAALAACQVGLGIVTLLLAVPLWAGLAHQILAMLLLGAAAFHARRCAMEASGRSGSSPSAVDASGRRWAGSLPEVSR